MSGHVGKVRDNSFVIVPRALVRQSEFDSAVAEVERILVPQVVRLRYTIGHDWTGEPSVFFKVTLSDAAASALDQLSTVSQHVSSVIDRQIQPQEQWDVLPYFKFRSQSEQSQLNEPAWA